MRDTIDMAREAGDDWDSTLSTDKEFLKRFEALVRADEREACAKVCENGIDTEHPTVKDIIMKNFGASSHLAAAIRARGEQP